MLRAVSYLRASFALRSVVLLVELGAIGAALWLCGVHPIGVLVVVTLVAVLETELPLLAALIGHGIVRRAERRGHHGSTFWFVDLDEQRRARAAAFVEDTRNNPTLR